MAGSGLPRRHAAPRGDPHADQAAPRPGADAEQPLAQQALPQRRLRLAQVNRSVQRGRIVQDRLRLWTQGVRDLVMELGCALHHFRVRLTPWQPMI